MWFNFKFSVYLFSPHNNSPCQNRPHKLPFLTDVRNANLRMCGNLNNPLLKGI